MNYKKKKSKKYVPYLYAEKKYNLKQYLYFYNDNKIGTERINAPSNY